MQVTGMHLNLSDHHLKITTYIYFILFLFYFWPHWAFVAMRGLFSHCGERALLFIVVCRLLIAVASFVVEHRL